MVVFPCKPIWPYSMVVFPYKPIWHYPLALIPHNSVIDTIQLSLQTYLGTIREYVNCGMRICICSSIGVLKVNRWTFDLTFILKNYATVPEKWWLAEFITYLQRFCWMTDIWLDMPVFNRLLQQATILTRFNAALTVLYWVATLCQC